MTDFTERMPHLHSFADFWEVHAAELTTRGAPKEQVDHARLWFYFGAFSLWRLIQNNAAESTDLVEMNDRGLCILGELRQACIDLAQEIYKPDMLFIGVPMTDGVVDLDALRRFAEASKRKPDDTL